MFQPSSMFMARDIVQTILDAFFLGHPVYFFHHIKFYFRFRQLIGLPVWGQFCCGCKGEESSTFFSGNIQYTFQYYMSPFCRSSSFFRWSSFYRLSSFLRSSSFFSLSSFFWSSSFLGHLHFRGCLHFEVIFLIYPLIRATSFLQHQNPT